MSKTSVRKRTGTYHHGDLRNALVEAALALLRAGKELSLRGAAIRAGVSHAAPYAHFRDKDALLAAIAASGYRLFAARLERASGSEHDLRAKKRALARAYVAFATTEPELFRLMFGPQKLQSAELEEASTTAFKALSTTVPGSSPGLGALAAWSLAHGLASLLVDGRISPSKIGFSSRDSLVDAVTGCLTLT